MHIFIKIGLASLLLIPALAFWVVEPYNNIPMLVPNLPPIESIQVSECDFSSSGVERKVRERLSEHLNASNLLGASIGFYTRECGTFAAAVEGMDKSKPIIPDYLVRETLTDYLDEKDVAMDFIFELLK